MSTIYTCPRNKHGSVEVFIPVKAAWCSCPEPLVQTKGDDDKKEK